MKEHPAFINKDDLWLLGHSRSFAVSALDRSHTSSYSLPFTCRNYVPVFYRFQDIASCLSTVAHFSYPACIWRPTLGAGVTLGISSRSWASES